MQQQQQLAFQQKPKADKPAKSQVAREDKPVKSLPVKKIVGDTIHITNLAKDVTSDDVKVRIFDIKQSFNHWIRHQLVQQLSLLSTEAIIDQSCMEQWRYNFRRTIEELRRWSQPKMH